MTRILEAARDRLIGVHSAELVVAYGSYASGTADEASDIDLVAFAPVSEASHDTTSVAGHELDAWIYPLAFPLNDPSLVRVHPTLVLHDPVGRFPAFEAAIARTRAEVLKPLEAAAKADLATWTRKMVLRSRAQTPEGRHRYHWLVFEAPELWCRFRDVPWEGPKKALAQMRRDDPTSFESLNALMAGVPQPAALETWLKAVVG